LQRERERRLRTDAREASNRLEEDGGTRSRAAVLAGEWQREELLLAQRGYEISPRFSTAVDLGRSRTQALVRERLDELANRSRLFAADRAHREASTTNATS
jgi:hypothetical protein